MLSQIQAALGYDALLQNDTAPQQANRATLSSVNTKFIVTRWQHLYFLRSSSQNIRDVCAVADLHTEQDASVLLKTLDLGCGELNSTAHDINLRCAVDIILWMRKEATDYIAQTMGWPVASFTPQCVAIFCTAVRALLPPACQTLTPRQAVERYGDLDLNKYTRHKRTYTHAARGLRKRVQAWGVQYNSEVAAYFKRAQESGYCVSSATFAEKMEEIENKLSMQVDRLQKIEKKLAKPVDKLQKIENNLGKQVLGKQVDKLQESEDNLGKQVDKLQESENNLGKKVDQLIGSVKLLIQLWKLKHPEDAAFFAGVFEPDCRG